MIKKDPSLIKNINNTQCYTCEEGSNFKVCRPFPSATNDLKCKEQCQHQYNASAYYYDKYGTKHCYCGNAKADCKQMANIKICDEKSGTNGESCSLKEGTVIGNNYVNEIDQQEKCQSECKKILKSDGLYCKEEMKCVCTDPKPLIESYEDVPISKKASYCPDTPSNFKCDNGSNVVTNESSDFPKSYLDPNKYFLGGDSNDNKNKKTAFCGCDQEVVKKYNTYFKDGTTLRSLWKCTIEEINNKSLPQSNLNNLFNQKVYAKTGGDQDKLKTLIAYEMCITTNENYDRFKEPVSPDIQKDGFGSWLKYHLSEESKSGKILNKMVRFLVMGMLLHALYRTVYPQSGDPKDSLVYAMFMPHQFLKGNDKGKGVVFAFSVVLILMIMSATYSFGVSKETWEGTGIGLFISLMLLGGGYYKQNKLLQGIGIAGAISSILYLLIQSAEGSNKNPENPSSDGGAFAKQYLPNFSSFQNVMTSGLAINIYFIIIAAFMTKIGATDLFGTILGFGVIAVISAIIQLIYSSIFQENVSETFKSSFSIIYWIVLGVFTGISVLSKLFAWGFNTEYLLPYVYATVIGVLPIALFLIIINIAIANYSPAIELLLLIMYRMSGMFIARDPNSVFGQFILKIFGKRPTDEWVVPFLPLVSNFIELFYYITGDNKPGYFDSPNISTGVGNKNMFMS